MGDLEPNLADSGRTILLHGLLGVLHELGDVKSVVEVFTDETIGVLPEQCPDIVIDGVHVGVLVQGYECYVLIQPDRPVHNNSGVISNSLPYLYSVLHTPAVPTVPY